MLEASSTANSAAISARSAPGRSWRVSKRSPRSSDSASSKIDFPAPVSPVSTVKPAPNSASRDSTTAKLRIDSRRSMNRQPWRLLSAGAQSLRRLAPVQLATQHGEVIVILGMQQPHAMLGAADDHAVTLGQRKIRLPV